MFSLGFSAKMKNFKMPFYFERLALSTIQQLESNLIPLTSGLFTLRLPSDFGESEITLKKPKTNRIKKQSHGFTNIFPIFLLDGRRRPPIGALRRILFFHYSSIAHFKKKGNRPFIFWHTRESANKNLPKSQLDKWICKEGIS